VSYHIYDLAHVVNGSQATVPGKRLHHEFMHDLKNQGNRSVCEYSAIHGGLRCRKPTQACWTTGMYRRHGNLWRKYLQIFRWLQAFHREGRATNTQLGQWARIQSCPWPGERGQRLDSESIQIIVNSCRAVQVRSRTIKDKGVVRLSIIN
jgi:hypothetical protein